MVAPMNARSVRKYSRIRIKCGEGLCTKMKFEECCNRFYSGEVHNLHSLLDIIRGSKEEVRGQLDMFRMIMVYNFELKSSEENCHFGNLDYIGTQKNLYTCGRNFECLEQCLLATPWLRK